MNRKQFLGIATGTILIAGKTYYLSTDKQNIVRADINENEPNLSPLKPDGREILTLASLAPSGHNTQPWFVKYLEPYQWIIGNDKNRRLPAIDSTQKETILSIGAFLQNLEYTVNNLRCSCKFKEMANTNQYENLFKVRLRKLGDIE